MNTGAGIREEFRGLEGTETAVVARAAETRGAQAVVRVRVTDDSGAAETDDILLQTVRNRPPQVVNLSATPHAADPGGDGSSSANDGGGGAGGRYKTIFSDSRTNNGSVNVSGGIGGVYGGTSYGEDGGTGTVYRNQSLVSVVVSVGSVQSR